MPIQFVAENEVPEEFKEVILYIQLSQGLDVGIQISLVEGSKGKIQAHVGGKLIAKLVGRKDW